MSEKEFTKSECPCEWCRETHSEAKKWDTYIPVTNLQQRGLDVVRKIEEQVKIRQQIEEKNYKKSSAYSREVAFFDLLGD
tara:strand:- start:2187 stop:2426 length:240 start_codon:yes stop_codon:yes gene_type:complete